MGVPYLELMGAEIPDPHDVGLFTRYSRRYARLRERENDHLFDSATHFYFATDGNDANDGLTTSTPKQTWSALQTIISNEEDPLVIHAFKRGQTRRESSGLTLDGGPLKITTWGSGTEPIYTQAANVISGATGWSNTTGTTWTIDTDTAHSGIDIGWLALITNLANKDGDDWIRWPFRQMTSQAEVEATPYSWYQNTSNQQLWVNISTSLVITNLVFEATHIGMTSDHGFFIENSAAGSIFEKFGSRMWGNLGGQSNDGWCFVNGVGGTGSVVFRDLTMAHIERHCAGSNAVGQTGGIMSFIRCRTGLTQTGDQGNLVQHITDFTGSEFLVANNWFFAGTVPIASLKTREAAHGIPYTSHPAASDEFGLRLAIDNNYKQLPVVDWAKISSYGESLVAVGGNEALGKHKSFHVNVDLDAMYIRNGGSALPYDRDCMVNPKIRIWGGWGAGEAASDALDGLVINGQFDIDCRLLDQQVWAVLYTTNLSPTVKYHNSHFKFYNMAGMTSPKAVGMLYPSLISTIQACTAELFDCIISYDETGSARCNVGWANTASNIKNLALGANVDGAADTSNTYGAGNGTNVIVLDYDPAPGFGMPSEIIGEGGATYTQRDAFGLMRPENPTIGPHEAVPFDYDPQEAFDRIAAVYAKLGTKRYIAGTDNPDGDIEMDDATGNFPGEVSAVTNDVKGKVLGGGGGTITGTGARVVDASGNPVAPASATTALDNKLGTPAGASVSADIATRAPASTALSTADWTSLRAGYLDNLSAGAVATAAALSAVAGSVASTLIAASSAASNSAGVLAKLAGITLLADWLRAGFRRDTADPTALGEINTGGGTYAAAASSQQGISDAQGAGLGITSSVNDSLPDVTKFHGGSELSEEDGFYSDAKCVITFTTGPLQGLSNVVSAYIGATRTFQFIEPWPVAPEDGDDFRIMGRIN